MTDNVRVKPLVWVERRNDYWSAKGTDFQVAPNGDGTWRVRHRGRVLARAQKDRSSAMQWTQAHHAAAIRACLEDVPEVIDQASAFARIHALLSSGDTDQAAQIAAQFMGET